MYLSFSSKQKCLAKDLELVHTCIVVKWTLTLDLRIGSNHWIYFGLQLRANNESHDENRGHH